MAEGLARVTSAGVPIEFDGETVLLPPLSLQDYGVIEQHILSKRPNPLKAVKEVLEGLDVEVQKHLLELAYQDMKSGSTATAAELVRFTNSTDGISMVLWLGFRKTQPGRWTLDQIQEIIGKLDASEVQKYIEASGQASGTDELGNSIGQTSASAK